MRRYSDTLWPISIEPTGIYRKSSLGRLAWPPVAIVPLVPVQPAAPACRPATNPLAADTRLPTHVWRQTTHVWRQTTHVWRQTTHVWRQPDDTHLAPRVGPRAPLSQCDDIRPYHGTTAGQIMAKIRRNDWYISAKDSQTRGNTISYEIIDRQLLPPSLADVPVARHRRRLPRLLPPP